MTNPDLIKACSALIKQKQPKYITTVFVSKLQKQQVNLLQAIIDATNWLPQDVAMSHRLYCIINNITGNVPCRQCGKIYDRKLIKFEQTKQQYLDTLCSSACTVKHRVANVTSRTSQKMGDAPKCKNPQCTNLCKRLPNSTKWANHCSNKCKANNPDTIAKRQSTSVAKYGKTNVLTSAHGKALSTQTIQSKYGVDNAMKSPVIKQQKLQRSYDNLLQQWPSVTPLFTIDQWKGWDLHIQYPWKCNECDHKFDAACWSVQPKCIKCNPRNISQGHKQISEFLTSLGIEHLNNDRSIISPNELDIYIPTRKLAIEYDGLYWHREQSVGKKYHIEKTQQCLQQGISLLHVFEDEWSNKQDVVKAIIKSKLGMNQKIAARKTTIQQIDHKTKKDFLNQYHIQGSDHHSGVDLGMLYDDRLVGVATFCKPRSVGVKTRFEDYWELARMAFLPDTTVVGGVGKFLSHFKSTGVADGLYTFADLRYSNANNNGYNQLMVFSHLTTPNYWYFNASCQQKWHRYNFAKHMLPNKLPGFDPALTEFDNMTNHGFFRIWDCGNACYFVKFR